MAGICDFCSSPDVHWHYPARDFVFAPLRTDAFEAGSKSAWAACNVCYTLIERGDRVRLTRRAAKKFSKRYGVSIGSMESEMRRLHDDFWANRLGAPEHSG